ncbi:Card1-like endonuclease domain-containing protein [Iningainema tapete]|uniref:DUF1887 family protein n=1 Tax=Iningainema tapete BLCC-T55 TaxID=2748662 RepID=A0A8J6XQA9_9CYAN|nr:DUF1887 family CARF protein [Iningainema tapete]MBD2775416.1 DUF1887 family protein [Iningainema tapete BLCC-T55]
MSESTMLVLIGGRSAVPAIAGALQFIEEVNRVKFLLCEGEQYPNFQRSIETVLKQEQKDLLCDETDVKSVEPSRFDDVYKAVSELCHDVKNLKYVNLTGVPQTMAFSVYSYVREKYKDVMIFSVNTHQSEIIPLIFGEKPRSFNKRLSVENYIAMCGLSIFKKKSGCTNSFLEGIAKYCAEYYDTVSKAFSVIRRKAKNADNIAVPKGFNFQEQEFTREGILQSQLQEIFKNLEQSLIIHNYQNYNNEIYFQIRERENYAFIAGDWLELFVYYSAKQCSFDSVEMGVELDNYRGEIDVFSLNSANAMICECKTGNYSSNDLSVLGAKAQKLGGNYCVKLFITSQITVSEEFKNQAKNNRVMVISGNELSRLPDILSKEMQNPTYSRS